MKFHSIWRFNILQLISHCKIFLRLESTQSKNDTFFSAKSKKKKTFMPTFTQEKLQALNDITSITLELDCVSWAKISVADLILLEWNSFELPQNFKNDLNDLDIMNLGYFIKQKIPSSDLYVMEKKNYITKYNEIFLRTVLMVLLNNFNKDLDIYDKVVIQPANILNIMHNLLVGKERKTTKEIVQKIFTLHDTQDDNNNYVYDAYSSVKISKEQMDFFAGCSRLKQESLSLSLLIILTFADINFFQNPEKKKALKRVGYYMI